MEPVTYNSKSEAINFIKECIDSELEMIANNETDFARATFDEHIDMIEQIVESDKTSFTFSECPMAANGLWMEAK